MKDMLQYVYQSGSGDDSAVLAVHMLGGFISMTDLKYGHSKRLIKTVLLLVLSFVMVIGVSLTANASAKSKAMKAYKKFLAKKNVVVIPKGTTMDYFSGKKYTSSPRSTLQFAIGYVNNDKVPELFVRTKSSVPYSNRCCAVFTCRGKKLYRLFAGDVYDSLTGYYKKTGYFCTFSSTEGTPYYNYLHRQDKTRRVEAAHVFFDGDPYDVYDEYVFGGKECSRSSYYQKVASVTKKKKMSKLKWYNNTSSKRKSKLK